MNTLTSLQSLDELKTRHRALWNLGDYTKVADTVIPHLGATLVDACRINPGDRVLDIASGSGNAALPAARRGGQVTAVDLSDSLLGVCAARARAESLTVDCIPADAENLPFPDAAFDVVLSCVGVMFAPHHQAAADELLRVCRPLGSIGILSWTPGGFVGQMLATMRPFVPAPPPGTQPPPLWGDPEHVSALLGAHVPDLELTVGGVRIDCFETPTDFREFFKANYGPTVAAYRAIADDPARAVDLDAALTELAAAHWDGDGALTWEYLVATGHRAGTSTAGR